MLTGATWLVYELFKSQTHEARAWLVPTALIILSLIVVLITLLSRRASQKVEASACETAQLRLRQTNPRA
jgi:cytochrome c-type biogenesis protein CcmH/NrfF